MGLKIRRASKVAADEEREELFSAIVAGQHARISHADQTARLLSQILPQFAEQIEQWREEHRAHVPMPVRAPDVIP